MQKVDAHEKWQRRKVGEFHCAHPRGQAAVSREKPMKDQLVLIRAFQAKLTDSSTEGAPIIADTGGVGSEWDPRYRRALSLL